MPHSPELFSMLNAKFNNYTVDQQPCLRKLTDFWLPDCQNENKRIKLFSIKSSESQCKVDFEKTV